MYIIRQSPLKQCDKFENNQGAQSHGHFTSEAQGVRNTAMKALDFIIIFSNVATDNACQTSSRPSFPYIMKRFIYIYVYIYKYEANNLIIVSIASMMTVIYNTDNNNDIYVLWLNLSEVIKFFTMPVLSPLSRYLKFPYNNLPHTRIDAERDIISERRIYISFRVCSSMQW